MKTITSIRRIEGFVYINKLQLFLEAIQKEAITVHVLFSRKKTTYYVEVDSEELQKPFYDDLVARNILIGYTVKEQH